MGEVKPQVVWQRRLLLRPGMRPVMAVQPVVQLRPVVRFRPVVRVGGAR